jgi:hypothetical protein
MTTTNADAPARVTSELRLTGAEGDALRVAQILVGLVRRGLPSSIDVKTPSPALLEAVARTWAAACVQMLLHNGGAKERLVLRDRRRRSGRLWDAGLNDLFELSFTRSPVRFWLGAVVELVPLAHKKLSVSDAHSVTREEKKLLAALAPEGFDGVGDLLFFALAHDNLVHLGLPPPVAEMLAHEIRSTIPLALLFAPDDPDIDVRAARGLLHTLTAPGPLRVIECIDDALVRAWHGRFRQILVHSPDRASFNARMRALARNLSLWLELLDNAERVDLARALARFLAALPRTAIPTGLDVRNHCLRLAGTTSIADRDDNLSSLTAVLDLRTGLDDARARLGAMRYGDERYEESQVVLRMLETDWQPERDAVDALARTLSGSVG